MSPKVQCGHVEAVRGTHDRAPNLYAAMENSNRGNPQQTINHEHLQTAPWPRRVPITGPPLA
jgi:hypothetical protein